MKWTSQQENAINADGSSLIVSAAAGSGKTAVLTERLVRLLADPRSGIRADRIIVVTFTNDAAAELKKRLDSKLRELINDSPADAHLLKQQVLLQNAVISTINSFCFELIRDNITDQGITSGFGILDDSDNAVMKSRALEELINYYSENDYESISYLYDKFCIKNEKGLTDAIARADNFLASVAFRDEWLDKAVAEYEKPFMESVYYSDLLGSVRRKLEKAQAAADSCCDLIGEIFPDIKSSAAQKSLAQAEKDLSAVDSVLAVIKSGRLPSAEEASAVTFKDLVRIGKAEHNKPLRELYKKKRDKVKKLTYAALSDLGSVESDYAESAKVTRILAPMLKKYAEILWAAKCEKNAISFDDGERLALELLADRDENGNIVQSETARRVSAQYDIIMIDEYQDSNNKQDMIFRLLSRNYSVSESGEPMYGDNVFLVGDVKQSIYRFRLANPANFINTLQSSAPFGAGSEQAVSRSIFLNRNFRSSQGVIDFVNYMFTQIMSRKCGDVDYDDNEMLYFGAGQYEASEHDETVTHISFIGDDVDEDGEPSDSERNIEAVFTARKIAEMLHNGVKVTLNDGSQRPCRPSDFCVLVRGNKYINVYADELAKLGVPAKRSEESGYLKSREIAVLIDLLRIISDPMKDIPMMAVMTSPMYMFDISDIALMKSLDRERPLYAIIRGLAAGDYENCDDLFLRQRCIDLLESLDKFRLNSVTMTLGELITSIYDTTDFISVMQLYSDGEKKRANLRALVQYAQNYDNASEFEGAGGLDGFLRHLDRVMESGDYAQGKISSSSEERVTVQTLHKSKGLEYPFVFIAETSCKFQYDSKTVMCSSDGKAGYILYDPKIFRKYRTFQQIMLASSEEEHTRSEEMRLLYVGLTRAKQKLFINLKTGEKAVKRIKNAVDSISVNGGDITEYVQEAGCFADWFWACIIKHSDFAEIAQRLEIDTGTFGLPRSDCSESLFEYEFADVAEVDPFEEIENTAEITADEKAYEEISAIVGCEYDRELSETPAKLSVTQMLMKNSDEGAFDFSLKRPKFKSETSELMGTERGTAIHTFFQYCDFAKAADDPESEIERMTEMGYISESQADSISVANTKAFFESELYGRIVSAKNVWRERKFIAAVSELDTSDRLSDVMKNSGGMIKGIIDLIFEEDDGFVIVDYKSDRGASAQKLAERYALQLRLYRSAVELTMCKKVKAAYLYSFELQKAILLDI